MKEAGAFPEGTNIQDTLSLYFSFCGIQLTCSQMGIVAATLANSGVCPLTRKRVFEEETVRDCLSLMSSCGLYDYSGQFSFFVGLPCKSAVSGCIFLVIPGLAGICIFSPPLDNYGNSVKGIQFAMELASKFNFHVFDSLDNRQKLDPRRKESTSLETSQTMLLFASAIGDLDRVQRLVARGINVNFTDINNRTALHLAACHGQVDVVAFLVSHDADVNAEDVHGNTALKDAEGLGHDEIVKLLEKITESRVFSGCACPPSPVTTGNDSEVHEQKEPEDLLARLDYEHELIDEAEVGVFQFDSDHESERSSPISINEVTSSEPSSADESDGQLSSEFDPYDVTFISYSLDCKCSDDCLVSKSDVLKALERSGLHAKFDHRLSAFAKSLSSQVPYKVLEEACSEIPILKKALLGTLVIPDWPYTMSNIKAIFESVAETPITGHNADYIQELAEVDPSHFGVGICSTDGQRAFFGDYTHSFSLQHCSNVLSYCLALEEIGEQEYHSKVGREASGLPSDHLSLLDIGSWIPHNPFCNTGALFSASSNQKGEFLSDRFDYIKNTAHLIAGCPSKGQLKFDHVGYSLTTYLSEMEASDRNYSLLYLMREKGVFSSTTDLQEVLKLYCMLMSVEYNVCSLSILAATLAKGGVCPLTGERIFKQQTVRACLSLMNSCSLYDYSGEWQFVINLPAVAGSSGALLIVVPDVLGIAIYSPPLNDSKITARGIDFARRLQQKYLLHPLESFTSNIKKNMRLWRNTSLYKEVSRLCQAAFNGELSEVRQLIRSRVNLNYGNYDSTTPLHCATKGGHLSIVKVLVENGADPLVRDRWGYTSLDTAKYYKHFAILEYLTSIVRK
ncbi:hypothetical protein GEMRC1_001935 [Eukaryota sp. GEM-RC1]